MLAAPQPVAPPMEVMNSGTALENFEGEEEKKRLDLDYWCRCIKKGDWRQRRGGMRRSLLFLVRMMG